MTPNQEKLVSLLKNMFQFDQADLDFGIYRIMNLKRNEINDYLERSLIPQISEGLQSLANIGNEQQIREIESQIANTKAMPISEAMKAPIIAELEAKKKNLSGTNIADIEGDVYTHLINFFSRYYDEGDFISQRRYKDGVYAIPYEGEEVKLHWANADQYYVKTSEYFTDYSFTTSLGKKVQFKLVDAKVEKDNIKSTDKKFFILADEKQYEIVGDELIVYFEYTKGEKKQEEYNKLATAFIAKELSSNLDWMYLFVEPKKGEKCEFEKQLYRYTARNTFDYFIHKNLKKFLLRELDFYIKNEVVYLDDISVEDMNKTKEYLVKAQTIKAVASKIIEFLAQIENFQKKMYLKKKLVVSTNYCITLDRIPEEFYAEIIANEAQREEWVKLFAIDEIKEEAGNLLSEGKVGYSVPLSLEFLKQNPFLVLDTKFFSEEFKQKLIESIDNLDESLNGLLIHSENFQALNLLQSRYNQQIKCCYIDPPYNAKSSEILYKNNYKHSSWLSLMENRASIAKKLLKQQSVTIVAIDEVEQQKLGMLLDGLYGDFTGKACVSVIINPSGQQGKNFSTTDEYLYFYYDDQPSILKKEGRDEETADVRNFMNGSKGESGDYLRETGRNCFYPIIVENNQIIGFGDVCDDSYHPSSSNVELDNGIIEIYPIDSDNVERKWLFERETVEDIIDELSVKKNRDSGLLEVIRTKTEINHKTVWTKPLFSAKTYGTGLLSDMFGEKVFTFPKSIYAVSECVDMAVNGLSSYVLDYFAGSGTTGHAVIDINEAQHLDNKYILIEMGEYFNSATLPRIEKVIYSRPSADEKGWKKGKPVSRKGISQAFKYLRLEGYEDTLNNIKFENRLDIDSTVAEEYLLKYMLESESEGSVFNVDNFAKPFDYYMSITEKQESRTTKIDLVESFNYLIGLVVERSYAIAGYDADFETGEYGAVTAKLKKGNTYKVKLVEGHTLSGEKILIIWRELTGDIVKDNAVLDAVLSKKKISTTDFEYDKIFVNGDNNLQNLSKDENEYKVALIEDEFQKRMFENE